MHKHLEGEDSEEQTRLAAALGARAAPMAAVPQTPTAAHSLRFSVEADLAACEALWRRFVPARTLFDLWEYRACFFDPERHSCHFLVASREEEPVGLLPLWYDRTDDSYEIFGDQLTANQIHAPHDVVTALLTMAPPRTFLFFLSHDHPHLRPAEETFYLDFDDYGRSLDTYLASFGKKHRKNLLHDLRQLTQRGYTVETNRLQDYARMTELNRARFGADSFFAVQGFTDGFRRMMEYAWRQGTLRMLSIVIDGKPEAVEVAVQHQDTYYVLMGGNNLAIPNIGKLLIVEHLKFALAHEARVVDFLTDDCGWKRLWNLREQQLFEYKNVAPKE